MTFGEAGQAFPDTRRALWRPQLMLSRLHRTHKVFGTLNGGDARSAADVCSKMRHIRVTFVSRFVQTPVTRPTHLDDKNDTQRAAMKLKPPNRRPFFTGNSTSRSTNMSVLKNDPVTAHIVTHPRAQRWAEPRPDQDTAPPGEQLTLK